MSYTGNLFTEISFRLEKSLFDVLVAFLAAEGYGHFLEKPEENTLLTAIATADFNEEVLKNILEVITSSLPITYTIKEVVPKNWNKLWESNYPYVIVNEDCAVRADFHSLPKPYRFELVITPKMSFGTGHHPTTALMLRTMMTHDFGGKTVLDVGTGTGILSIMALKLGASYALACDLDRNAVENATENAQKNKVENFEVFCGTLADVLPQKTPSKYDFVLANINKNVILAEIEQYLLCLKQGGILMISGFYEADFSDLKSEAEKHRHVQFLTSNTAEKWVAATFLLNAQTAEG